MKRERISFLWKALMELGLAADKAQGRLQQQVVLKPNENASCKEKLIGAPCFQMRPFVWAGHRNVASTDRQEDDQRRRRHLEIAPLDVQPVVDQKLRAISRLMLVARLAPDRGRDTATVPSQPGDGNT